MKCEDCDNMIERTKDLVKYEEPGLKRIGIRLCEHCHEWRMRYEEGCFICSNLGTSITRLTESSYPNLTLVLRCGICYHSVLTCYEHLQDSCPNCSSKQITISGKCFKCKHLNHGLSHSDIYECPSCDNIYYCACSIHFFRCEWSKYFGSSESEVIADNYCGKEVCQECSNRCTKCDNVVCKKCEEQHGCPYCSHVKNYGPPNKW